MRKWLTTAGCLLALGWLALVASNRGIVVWQEQPSRLPGQSLPVVRCTYFTGVNVFSRGYLYTRRQGIGLAGCPVLATP